MPLAPTVETVPVQWLRAVLPDAVVDHDTPPWSSTFAAEGGARVTPLGDDYAEETGLRRSLVQVDLMAYKTADGTTPDRPDWSAAHQLAETVLAALTVRSAHLNASVSRTGYFDARVLDVARLEGPLRMPDPHRVARVRIDLAVTWTKGTTST